MNGHQVEDEDAQPNHRSRSADGDHSRRRGEAAQAGRHDLAKEKEEEMSPRRGSAEQVRALRGYSVVDSGLVVGS
jgi:hypothetical protein